jgi:hypothetical protein
VRNKRARLVPVQALFHLGLRLFEEAESKQFARDVWRASAYRHALIILILACRPMRARNLTGMILGRHLVKTRAAARRRWS